MEGLRCGQGHTVSEGVGYKCCLLSPKTMFIPQCQPATPNPVRPGRCSVAQSCPTLCNPMNLSTPGLPVHHQLPEFTQTHVHRAGDAIQPSHPLLSPPPPDLNPYILDQGKLLSKAQRLVAIG